MRNRKECTRMVHRVHLGAYFSVKLEKLAKRRICSIKIQKYLKILNLKDNESQHVICCLGFMVSL